MEGAFYIPDSGRKNEIIVTRIISTSSPPPISLSPSFPLVLPLLLVEVFAFFAEVGT